MSVTYLTHNNKHSWDRPKSIAISSASLDALMSTTNSQKDDNILPEMQRFISKSSLKRPLDCNLKQEKHSNMKFVPSQILKSKRSLTSRCDGGSSEIRTNKRTLTSSDTRYSSSSSSQSSSLESSLDESETSSVYLTPENKWTPKNTPEVNFGSPTKRPIIDQVEEHYQSSPVSSQDSYYTPERSPTEFESTSKRKRIRWSEPNNLISLNDSVSSDYLNGSFVSVESQEAIQPELIGYQLIGDSQFCRFGQQLLGLKRVPTPNSSGRIGICVSGQTISDLHRRVREKFYPISDKVILMIGTNDFLRNKDVTTMCQELSHLISTLQETVTNIVLLTLPPIPKLAKNTVHFRLLEKYNQYIRSLDDGDRIAVADISPLYVSRRPQQGCIMDLFEMYFQGPARRFDMIHLNRKGLEVIRKYIMEHFM